MSDASELFLDKGMGAGRGFDFTWADTDEPGGRGTTRHQMLSSSEAAGYIHVRLGAFDAGVIAGCSRVDDPTPVDSITEHCQLLLAIDPATSQAWVIPHRDQGPWKTDDADIH